MSFFGKNIKKIRGIKSLSQQSFAELFDLKRATLGAYEEERSEPKIDTIINIANYFSIPIDDLLTKELTVNRLLKFKGELTLGADETMKESFPSIPCITENNAKEYILNADKTKFIQDMPSLRLPINSEKRFRAYTITDLEMTDRDNGFFPKDVVIGEWTPKSVIKKLNNGTPVLVLAENQLIFLRMFTTSHGIILRADHKSIDDIRIDHKDIKELWRIRYVFYRRIPDKVEDFEDRIARLEENLRKLS